MPFAKILYDEQQQQFWQAAHLYVFDDIESGDNTLMLTCCSSCL